jgi:hypothetical protein
MLHGWLFWCSSVHLQSALQAPHCVHTLWQISCSKRVRETYLFEILTVLLITCLNNYFCIYLGNEHNIMSPTSDICHQPGSRPGTDEEIVAANHGGSARFRSLSWGILGETMGIHVVHMFFKLLKCWKFTSSPKHDEIIWSVIIWFNLPSGKWSKQWGGN